MLVLNGCLIIPAGMMAITVSSSPAKCQQSCSGLVDFTPDIWNITGAWHSTGGLCIQFYFNDVIWKKFSIIFWKTLILFDLFGFSFDNICFCLIVNIHCFHLISNCLSSVLNVSYKMVEFKFDCLSRITSQTTNNINI